MPIGTAPSSKPIAKGFYTIYGLSTVRGCSSHGSHLGLNGFLSTEVKLLRTSSHSRAWFFPYGALVFRENPGI